MSKQVSIQEQAYLEGFIDKCAEYGVDHEALQKLAMSPGKYGRAGIKQLSKMLQADARGFNHHFQLGQSVPAIKGYSKGSTISPNALLRPAVVGLGPNSSLGQSVPAIKGYSKGSTISPSAGEARTEFAELLDRYPAKGKELFAYLRSLGRGSNPPIQQPGKNLSKYRRQLANSAESLFA
jgi:hypothetical protein